jgi:membrane protein DedA with SNARE-associated domain/membrane-associated phospholipid phosphatase
MSGLLSNFMHWVSAHPNLTGLIVGVIACAESLAFIGMLVPGAALMLAAGALVGAGLVDFWSMFAWSVGGAVLGDGVSYWLGHRYREQLRSIKLLRRHPQWLARGTDFFQRHGGKSILLARFVGPVRPVIPVVAGMLGMSPLRFYLNNILSALAWAPTHLLAGMVVGASLVLAGQVATRLAIVLGVLLASVWFIVWLVHLSYRQMQPRLATWTNRVLQWSRLHPRLSWLFTDLYDPTRPPARALLVWLGLLIASVWLFLGVLEDVLTQDPLVYAGQAIFNFLQQLRTPLGDAIMIVFTELGDASVTIPLVVVVLLWLLWRRDWRGAVYWLSALGFGVLAVTIIKMMLKLPRPVNLYSGVEVYSFPSGHATMSTVIYGLLAVFIARAISTRWRWIIYASAILLIIAISISRLYLGAHWLADVTAGLALGSVGIAILAIAYERHRSTPSSGYGLLVLALLVFIGAASLHIHRQFDFDSERYSIRHPINVIATSAWWEQDWEMLPTWRHDLRGEREQPLNVQWAGELHTIKQDLLARGWHEPLMLNARTALSWLIPHPTFAQLPVLPQLNDGQYESLVLVHASENKSSQAQQLILRLWPTTLRLKANGTPLWIGTIASQRLAHLPLVSFPRLTGDYDQALTSMASSLTKMKWQALQRQLQVDGKKIRWDGTVLLINSSP